jgi:hypothetical protein
VVRARKKNKKIEIDKELTEIREKMERLALKMQQYAKVHWTYEWPLKRKVKWLVHKATTNVEKVVEAC